MDMAASTVRKYTRRKKLGGKMILLNELREAEWQPKEQPGCGFTEKMDLTETTAENLKKQKNPSSLRENISNYAEESM